MLYGAAMGSFSGIGPERLLHIAYAAFKVPMLLLVAFLISWPSFAVACHLLGLRDNIRAATRALLGAQIIVAVVLASMAPLTLFWYFNVRQYETALLWNAGVFLTASLAGQIALRRSYSALIQVNRRHRFMLWVWIGVYSLVGIQLGWVLRPFIGSPFEAVQFLRLGQLSNAYVHVAKLLWAGMGGS